MKITPNDIDWLSNNYPGLKITIDDTTLIIKGVLHFLAEYNLENGTYTINPELRSELFIEDRYEIEIFIQQNSNRYPIIKEISQRLSKLAQIKKTDPSNLHVYYGLKGLGGLLNNALCTIGPIDQKLIEDKLSLKDLVEKILVPFFYDSSYFESHGKRLRQDYSHDVWGVIENYLELDEPIGQEIRNFVKEKIMNSKRWHLLKDYLVGNKILKGHLSCLVCGDNKMRTCHPRVFNGLLKIKNEGIFKS